MLVIRLELDKSKENYQAAMKALEDFEILSASWEDEAAPVQTKITATIPKDDGDLGSKLSNALSRINKNPS